MRLAFLALFAVFGLLCVPLAAAQTVGGGGGDFVTQPNPGSPEVSPPQLPPVQRGGPVVRSRSPLSVVDMARANAAARAGVSVDQVSVISVEPVDWPDFQLGCPSPKPGLAFAQVVIPGFIVQLNAAGTPMRFHTDWGSRAIMCEALVVPPPVEVPIPPPDTPDTTPPLLDATD